jgi:hypothetical protein
VVLTYSTCDTWKLFQKIDSAFTLVPTYIVHKCGIHFIGSVFLRIADIPSYSIELDGNDLKVDFNEEFKNYVLN